MIDEDGESQLTGVVGAQVTVAAAAAAANGATGALESITYTVSGAVSGQQYSWAAGTTPLTSGAVAPVNGGNIAPYQFYWDNTTGTQTVEVVANYAYGNSASTTVSVNVVQPKVNLFSGYAQPFTFGATTYPSAGYGLHMGDGYAAPGIEFQAEVNNNVPFQGQFAVIQLTTVNRAVTAGGLSYTQKSSGNVLDNAL